MIHTIYAETSGANYICKIREKYALTFKTYVSYTGLYNLFSFILCVERAPKVSDYLRESLCRF